MAEEVTGVGASGVTEEEVTATVAAEDPSTLLVEEAVVSAPVGTFPTTRTPSIPVRDHPSGEVEATGSPASLVTSTMAPPAVTG